MGEFRYKPTTQELSLLHSIIPVSRETQERLEILVRLLNEWQAKTNLISRHTQGDVWTRHICDSAQIWCLGKELATKNGSDKRALNWVDLGSGGGFPGLVVAILAASDEAWQVEMHLVESIAKKCAFLRRVLREVGVEANVHSERIESVSKQNYTFDIVSARALSALKNLFDLSSVWLETGATGLFPKGRDYLCELEECRGLWEFDLIEHKSKVANDSVILEINNLRRK